MPADEGPAALLSSISYSERISPVSFFPDAEWSVPSALPICTRRSLLIPPHRLVRICAAATSAMPSSERDLVTVANARFLRSLARAALTSSHVCSSVSSGGARYSQTSDMPPRRMRIEPWLAQMPQ